MPVDLAAMLAPSHTAMLTMEMQRGVFGTRSPVPDLARVVREDGVIANIRRLAEAARATGVPVVHCTVERRADGAGSADNCPLLHVVAKGGGGMTAGSPAAAVIDELGPDPADIICPRAHGVSPFIGTTLDPTLRSLGVRTVIASGVSVNLGVLGMVIEAVNFGYTVVLPTDATAGFPREYADAVCNGTLALLATRVTTDDVIAVWTPSALQ
ncbi:MAG TPA: isochorismatase family cysteine hydrolase [Mycobacteriales bacterium]|nr:isochorismatase family cysteine hydrolase [Mycobacteriales bacterium]